MTKDITTINYNSTKESKLISLIKEHTSLKLSRDKWIDLKNPPDEYPTAYGRTWGEIKNDKESSDSVLPLAIIYRDVSTIKLLHGDEKFIRSQGYHTLLTKLLKDFKV